MTKKKVWGFLLLLVLFGIQSGAGDVSCQMNQPCTFSVRTVNGSDIVNEQICNITIWNSSHSVVVDGEFMENYSDGWQKYNHTFSSLGDYAFSEMCIFGGATKTNSGFAEVSAMIETTLAFPVVTLMIAILFGFFAIYLNNKAMQPIKIAFFMMCLFMIYFTTSLMAQQAHIEGSESISNIMTGLSNGLWWIIFFVFCYVLFMFMYECWLVADRKKQAKNKGEGGYWH